MCFIIAGKMPLKYLQTNQLIPLVTRAMTPASNLLQINDNKINPPLDDDLHGSEIIYLRNKTTSGQSLQRRR